MASEEFLCHNYTPLLVAQSCLQMPVQKSKSCIMAGTASAYASEFLLHTLA